jgi:hypothetical protein
MGLPLSTKNGLDLVGLWEKQAVTNQITLYVWLCVLLASHTHFCPLMLFATLSNSVRPLPGVIASTFAFLASRAVVFNLPNAVNLYNTVFCVVVIPNHEIISLLFCNCNFASYNHNVCI